MAKWLDRIVTRAASGVETRALPGAGAGMGNTITTPSSGSGPVKAGTQPISYSGPGTPLSPDWNGQAAIDGAYFQSVWVQRPLSAIAETIAGLPFVAGMDPENPAVTNPQAVLARLLGPASPRAPGGPNPRQSAASFWKWNITQKLATGKMAWELQLDPTAMRPDGKGKAIVGLWSLVSFLLDPIPTGGGSTEYFSGYKYNLSHDPLYMKPERVFYAWRPSQRDPRQPESFLQAAALPISISVAIERYMWALLKNGMVATHVVTAAPLEEPENRRAWEEQFISSFTGFDQAGKPIFAYADVENGKVTDAFSVTPIAQTSQQAELLAFAGWVKNEILVATGVPESLIGNASQRIYSNADSEYRTFWTNTVINIVAELQDDVNTQLAPLLGPEVGWFDLSRVVALQPPTPFAQPQLTDLMAAGIMSVPQAQSALGVEDSGFIDTSDAPIGEESSTVGPGTSSKASAPMPELRGWSWEYRGMNTHTLQSGTWRRLIHQRERIVVPPAPQPMEVIDVASTPIDTRGYQAAERILATVTALREKRVGPEGYVHGWIKVGGGGLGPKDPKWTDGKWKLTGIQHAKGQCDHCGRDLGKVFQVKHPDGDVANLGSTHAAKATGYSKVQAEADRQAKLAARDAKRAEAETKLRAEGHGDVIDQLKAMPQLTHLGMASAAQEALQALLDGKIDTKEAVQWAQSERSSLAPELRYQPESLADGYDAWFETNSAWLEQQVADPTPMAVA